MILASHIPARVSYVDLTYNTSSIDVIKSEGVYDNLRVMIKTNNESYSQYFGGFCELENFTPGYSLYSVNVIEEELGRIKSSFKVDIRGNHAFKRFKPNLALTIPKLIQN